MELKESLGEALKKLALGGCDADVALALLHAQSMSANDHGWPHCSEAFLRGVARSIDACADELERDGDETATLSHLARKLGLAAQVVAGLAAEFRVTVERRAEAEVQDPPTQRVEPDAAGM